MFVSAAYLFFLCVEGEALVGVVLKLLARAAAKLLRALVAYLRSERVSEEGDTDASSCIRLILDITKVPPGSS